MSMLTAREGEHNSFPGEDWGEESGRGWVRFIYRFGFTLGESVSAEGDGNSAQRELRRCRPSR